jgi:hypothetical protein
LSEAVEDAPAARRIEQGYRKAKVVGSNPTGGTLDSFTFYQSSRTPARLAYSKSRAIVVQLRDTSLSPPGAHPMFEFIRTRVRNAILAGVNDAMAALYNPAREPEAPVTLQLEHRPTAGIRAEVDQALAEIRHTRNGHRTRQTAAK